MAASIKGISVEIGGNTTGLSKALEDVNKQSYALGGELKTVDKLLKLDPGNLTLVKQKQDILKESISATSDKLKTLKDAQSQVEQQFKKGDLGRDQYLAFQKELVTTEQKLSGLKEEEKSVSVIGTAFKNVKQTASDLHTKLEPIENGLKKVGSAAAGITSAGIKTVSGAVDVAGKALAAYAAAATGAATGAFALTASAGAAADDINTLAKQTGLSTEQIQKFRYASDIIDVSMDTLTGSMTKNIKSMASAKDGTGAAADAYKTLGVNVRDSVTGELRNSQDVFNESIAALGNITNETERDVLAMQLFGKSAQDLNPLILGGADALKVLGDEASAAGLILSQTALDDLNEFNDSIDVLKANAAGSKQVLAGTFANSFKSLTDTIGSSLPGITESLSGLFSGQNRKKAQAQLTSDLTDLGQSLISNLNDMIPDFLEGFNSVIFAVVDSVVAVLPSIIETTLPALITGFFELVSGLVEVVPVLLPILVDGALALFMGLLDGINLVIPQLMDMLPKLINDIGDMLIENLPTIIESGFELIISLITGIAEAIPTLMDKVVALIPVIVQAITDNLPLLIDAGLSLIIALAEGLPKAIPEIILAIPEIIEAMITTIMETDWLDIGVQILKGIGEGLISGVGAIGEVIAEMCKMIFDKIKAFFGIKSPSRLFRDEVGTYLAKGIGVGFEGEMENVTRSMQKALPTSFDTNIELNPNGKFNGLGQIKSGVIFNQNNYSPKALSRFDIYKNTQAGLQLATAGVR